jgi:uncharacterized membrane protein YoaK (UPF0700 family)
MPLPYLRRLTGRHRSEAANRQLGRYLAFLGGAVNAGGYLAVHQYTSHMSGIVSAMADNLAIGSLALVGGTISALLAFLAGAATTGLLQRWARRRELESEFALPLILEALLLLGFGITGREFEGHSLHGTVALLCFTMGLQNAILTRISGTVVRTTHVTGMVTDLGIKLGSMLHAVFTRQPLLEGIEVEKLTLLSSLVGLFFVGGVTGALGFKHAGFLFTLPLASGLILLAVVPVFDDLRRSRRAARSS